MLSKGDLMSWRQCARRLWLERHEAHAANGDESNKRQRLKYGRMVGERARSALGPDLVWPSSHPDLQTRVGETAFRLQQQPLSIGVETPFVRAGLHCRADAVIRTNGHYTLQETKASTFPLKRDKETPGEPYAHHVEDVAIQYWAAQASGLAINKAELNLLDSQWVYPGNGDYQGLFRTLDISNAVDKLSTEIPKWIAQADAVLSGGRPAMNTGPHCQKPYPCPFAAHCKALDAPSAEHPVDLLPDGPGKALARKLMEKGYASLLDVPADELTGAASETYRRMQQAHATGQGILDAAAADAFAQHAYPRYFLDFEGINLPIPRWAGVRAYEQIPFQWSCHVECKPGEFEHREFLDITGDDPSLRCVEALMQFIEVDSASPIYVFNATYEREVLRGLAKRHPQHTEALEGFIERLADLLPMVKRHYYHPEMRGRFTLKGILPCIAPDLRYGELDEVSNGVAAQDAYIAIALEGAMSTEQIQQTRENLLAYCKLDTWALVEVAYHLEGRDRPPRLT